MRHYEVIVARDGKWWMVAIPEIDGVTQARRLGEAELMAREYIALTLDVPLENVAVSTTVQSVDEINVAEVVAEIDRERLRAAELESHARELAESLAKSLAARKIPVRDIGTMMGVSFQRAHQLVAAAATQPPTSGG